MLTKDSPEVQDLLSRIQDVVPGLTGPVGNLWEDRDTGYLALEITYDQDAPTPELREFRPGHYGLLIEYNPYGYTGGWEVRDYGNGSWYIPATETDDALL